MPNITKTFSSILTHSSTIAEPFALLLLRLLLAPVLIQAGWNKYSHFSDTVNWFGNTE